MDTESEDKEENNKKLSEEEILKLELSKKRKLWAGGLYTYPKSPHREGFQASVYYWDRNPKVEHTNDFMTLIRKATCIVLANQGFLIREFFINEGRQIALVLSLPEENMKGLAEKMKINKQVEFGVADIMSLEPIDSLYRPLRTNMYLLDENLWDRTYTTGLSKVEAASRLELRKFIVKLLEGDCNFKSIVRLCQGTWNEANISSYSTGVYSHQKVNIEIWYQFREYLVEVAMHIREIKVIKEKMDTIFDQFYKSIRVSSKGNLSRRKVDTVEILRVVNRLVIRAMQKAIGSRNLLSNIWQKIKEDPTDYAFPFESSTNKMRPRNRLFYEMLWKDYYYHYPYEQDQYIDNQSKLRDASIALADPGIGNEAAERANKIKAENSTKIYHYKFTKIERLKIASQLVALSKSVQPDHQHERAQQPLRKNGVAG